MEPLAPFSPETRAWFERTFSEPTPAQALGWPAIATGKHTLIQAPTGSGKTLAAFLYGIDRLNPKADQGLRLLYVSPLKALNYDIERNLRGPLAGLQSELRIGVRTGDTPQKERAAMLRNPPDIRRASTDGASENYALIVEAVSGLSARDPIPELDDDASWSELRQRPTRFGRRISCVDGGDEEQRQDDEANWRRPGCPPP